MPSPSPLAPPRRRRRPRLALPAAILAAAGSGAFLAASGADQGSPPPPPPPESAPAPLADPPAHAAPPPSSPRGPSRAVGLPFRGRLVRGVQLPAEGEHFFTWDPVLELSPNRDWRRHGTDRLVRLVLRVAEQHRRAHPEAPRIAIGDLSRPRGGDFGRRYGGIGHASHQNGLDVDIYYPRRDRRERAPRSVAQVDLRLAQDLVDRFVAAGAQYVFVGPSTGLRGPRRVVQRLRNHDDHLHVRIYRNRRPSR